MGCKILKRVIWPWPRPFQGRFFLRQGGTCYGKLMYQIRSLWVHPLRSYEWWCNMQKMGWLGALKVMGNATIRYSAYDFLFDFNRNYVSILYRFRDVAGCLSKVTDFDHPTCIRRPRQGWPRSNFTEIFGIRKLESLGYRLVLFVWSYVLPF